MDVFDSLDDENEIDKEHEVIDEHESRVAHIVVSLKSISSFSLTTSFEPAATIKTEGKELDVLRGHLADLETNIRRMNGKIGTINPGPSLDYCLLEQYNKQVNVFEMELLDVSHSISTIEDAKALPDAGA